MQLKPFLLDAWLDQYEHDIEFNLAASTGPSWTVNDILALADDETRHRFLNHKLVYSRPAGADSLREAIAEMQGVPVEAVQIVTGASEALVALMWLAAEPGANVIIPQPGFTTFSALPESLGLETRFYHVRRENGFRIDPDEIKRLADSKTKLILVNSPHNPTGATISDEEMEALHDFAAERGIQLVSDEVYHPIYHGRQTKSAARLPHATVISDLSKAFSIAGVRTGMDDRARRTNVASNTGRRALTSQSATRLPEKFFRKSPSASATSSSARPRKSPPETSSSSSASWPTIATYSAGYRRKEA